MAGEDMAAEEAALDEAQQAQGGAAEAEAADVDPAEAGAPGGQADAEGGEPDWKARARQWEGRAKSRQAQLAEKDAEIARMAAQIARADAVAEVAREKNVDASLLARMAGDTPEEIAANADALADFARSRPGYPDAPDDGAGRPSAMTREQIEAERDPVRRARLMGANKHLYI